MNIELGNIKSAFKAENAHMSELAMRIQRKAGIEVKELFEEPELNEPIIPRQPVQLSVEFGNSYVAEAAEETFIEAPDEADFGSINEQDIEVEANAIETEYPQSTTIESEDVVAQDVLPETQILDSGENNSANISDEGNENEVLLRHSDDSELEIRSQEINEALTDTTTEHEVQIEAASSVEVGVEQEVISQGGQSPLSDSLPPSSSNRSVDTPFELPEVVVSTEDIEAEKQRAADIERKRAEAAARYAALLDESRADYVPISKAEETKASGLPWGSILGVVASVAAIVSAWWVWNLIQTPITVEQVVENTRQTAPVVTNVNSAKEEIGTIEVSSLEPESQLVLDLIWNETLSEPISAIPHFTEMNERSKKSMVILENQALLVMDMEDQLFDGSAL